MIWFQESGHQLKDMPQTNDNERRNREEEEERKNCSLKTWNKWIVFKVNSSHKINYGVINRSNDGNNSADNEENDTYFMAQITVPDTNAVILSFCLTFLKLMFN